MNELNDNAPYFLIYMETNCPGLFKCQIKQSEKNQEQSRIEYKCVILNCRFILFLFSFNYHSIKVVQFSISLPLSVECGCKDVWCRKGNLSSTHSFFHHASLLICSYIKFCVDIGIYISPPQKKKQRSKKVVTVLERNSY